MKRLFFLAAAASACALCQAEIYKCADGVFTDSPCQNGQGTTIKDTSPKATIEIDFVETTSHFVVNAQTMDGVYAILRAQVWAAYNLSHPPTISYVTKAAGRNCELGATKITVTNNNHMPQWTHYANATVDERREWNSFYDAITIHENGHRAIAREFTVFLREKLSGIGPKPCDELDRWMKRQESDAWLQLRSRQVAYDAQTQHGIAQMGRR